MARKKKTDQSMTVMVANASMQFCRSMEYYLKRSGHEVLLVQTGAAALGTVERNLLGLSIVDVDLYPETGFKILQEAKKHFPEGVVWLTTKKFTAEQMDAATKAGADKFLSETKLHSELSAAGIIH